MSRWATEYVNALRRGETVTFRPVGHSMEPRIMSGQQVTVEPVNPRDLTPGDVVLCELGTRQYLDIVKEIRIDGFLIGNNKGNINGVAPTSCVYGRLIENHHD